MNVKSNVNNMYAVEQPDVTYSSDCDDREEWTWLQSHVFSTTNGSVQNLIGDDEGQLESSGLVDFVRSLRAAVTLLLTKLSIPLYRVTQELHPHSAPPLQGKAGTAPTLSTASTG